jgi:hypothetical protein
MNKACFLALGTVMALGSALFVGAGCGGETGGTGGAGGTGASSSSSTTTSSSSSVSSSTSSGGGVAATCAGYCTAIMANCNVMTDPGSTQQYKDMTSCMNVCKTFPPGKIGEMAGDSLECRAYHAGAAKTAATTHCEHAGPAGGAKSGAVADDGPCGNGCEAFCNLAVPTCPTEAKDMATCKTLCEGYAKDTAAYSITDVDKNDFGCRMYHLSVAATDAAAATTHCPHIMAVSATCTK